MPGFLIALLIIATVFLILGVIGRGLEASSGTFTFKIEGKVGPFPRFIFLIFSVIFYAVALVLFLRLIGPSKPPNNVANTSPARVTSSQISSPTSPSPSPSPTSPSPSPSPSELSAGKIADDMIGEVETGGVNNGRKVTNTSCYQDTVRQDADGTTQAECDVTLSNGVILRAAVSDNGNGATSYNQYQENLSASDIANAVYGVQATGGLTVTASTCYANTMQIENSGYTQVKCNLTFSNGNTYYDTVTYNGISTPSF
jgi:hypothetical protein